MSAAKLPVFNVIPHLTHVLNVILPPLSNISLEANVSVHVLKDSMI